MSHFHFISKCSHCDLNCGLGTSNSLVICVDVFWQGLFYTYRKTYGLTAMNTQKYSEKIEQKNTEGDEREVK